MTATEIPAAGELVVRALRRYPQRTAFVHGDRKVSYAEAGRRIGGLLAHFDALGLRPGDTVLQFVRNRPEQWFVQAACAVGGLRSVGMPPSHPPVERDRLTALCEAQLVLTDADHDALDVQAALPDCRCGPEDVVRLAFTSGTTGPSKGVLLSGRSLAATALFTLADGEWPEEVRLLCAEPVSGGFGTMVLPALLRGGSVLLLDHDGVVDPGAVVAAAERYRPTVAYLFTPSLRRVVHDPRAAAADWSSLRLLAYSGASLPADSLAAALSAFGPVLAQVYGQTECPKALAVLGRAEHDAGLADTDVGVPFTGMRIALLSPSGTAVAPGEPGELCVRGPAVMSGYWRDAEATDRASRGGWHHTGDVCRADSRGHLHVVGRVEDVIVRSGQVVHPAELEAVLAARVGPCAVLGVPDQELGEAVVAVAPDGLDRLRTAVAGLPVDRVATVPQIPQAWIGRVDRRAVRALLEPGP